MKGLVIGAGQIGKALFEIFNQHHECYIKDLEDLDVAGIEVMHVAFPYSQSFVNQVHLYQAKYAPKLTVIHSSVPIGTTEKCGHHAVHSPERGRFPNLAKEMILYTKFVGGYDMEDVDRACHYFSLCGWVTQACDSPRTTEGLKLLSNVHMGLEIAWRQEIERMECDPEFYRLWEESYRSGYLKRGQHDLIRPIMRPDPIGGHCILSCVDMLRGQIDSTILNFIEESNEKRKQEIECRAFRAAGSAS